VLLLRWSVPRYISKLVVLVVWIFIAFVVGIPYVTHMKEPFYGNAGYCKWCILDCNPLFYQAGVSLKGVG
jgi:hypothetical protein